MKLAFLLVLIIVFFINASPHNYQVNFNPPEWIIGQWSNSAESNTNKIDTFAFQKHNIIYTQGLFSQQKPNDFAKEYSIFKIKEVIDSVRYKIILTAENKIIEYVFIKIKGSSNNPEALSYSIKENNKVIRQYSNSINCVLFRGK